MYAILACVVWTGEISKGPVVFSFWLGMMYFEHCSPSGAGLQNRFTTPRRRFYSSDRGNHP